MVYLLKMSDDYNEVDPIRLKEFVVDCKLKALSQTKTGLVFPIEEELLEESLNSREND